MKDFIKTVIAVFVGLILFSVLGAGVAVLVILSLGSKLEETTQKVEENSILVYDLSLYISDRPQQNENFVSLDAPWNLTLRSLLNSIKAAKNDDNIKALYLNGERGNIGAGLSSIKEIRQALEDFKTSGKPVIAYSVDWLESGYYLASAANTIVVNPVGSLSLDGFRAEVEFYGGALEKYGIGMQVVRVGKYKSAVEPFTEKKFSAANRQQLEALLGDIWTELLAGVGGDREINIAQLKTLSQQEGILTPESARQKGLVDTVQHLDEVQDTLRQLSAGAALEEAGIAAEETKVEGAEGAETGTTESSKPESSDPESSDPDPSDPEPSEDVDSDSVDPTIEGSEENEDEENEEDSFPQIGIVEYSRRLEAESQTAANEIAILYAEGTIVSGEGDLGFIGSEEYVAVLQDLRQNQDVKAVVLRINSPGGSATASYLIEREVELLQATKPVIVSMGEVAASGGYMIAAPAQTIVAEPNTITGSIGVYGLLPNAQKLANNNGITWDSVTTGPYANLYTIARPRSASEMALLQKFVDQFYTDFIAIVADGRNLPPSKVNEIAQGRVWSGVAAQKVKLVDELGGLQTAIDRAVAAANLEEGEWYIAEYPYIPSLEEEIIDRLFGDLELSFLPQTLMEKWLTAPDRPNSFSPPVANMMNNIQDDWATLLEFSDPRQIYMRLPYRLRIE